jgi:hypothetical protein
VVLETQSVFFCSALTRCRYCVLRQKDFSWYLNEQATERIGRCEQYAQLPELFAIFVIVLHSVSPTSPLLCSCSFSLSDIVAVSASSGMSGLFGVEITTHAKERVLWFASEIDRAVSAIAAVEHCSKMRSISHFLPSQNWLTVMRTAWSQLHHT